MSKKDKRTDEEPLEVSSACLGEGGASTDVLCLSEAIYALAREVRSTRHAIESIAKKGGTLIGSISDRLEEIRDRLT